jgi:hypothetical protein
MSNPFELCFTLKQHTPIIHFQHHQDGATLRASEVKPKLDKFLIKNAFQGDFELYKIYLIGYDATKNQVQQDFEGKEAFDYKLRIKPNENWVYPAELPRQNNKGAIVYDTIPCYFGNMGDENKANPKGLAFSQKTIEVTISSFHIDLFLKIDPILRVFFFNENFGTRQSKGFGSFTVVSIRNVDAPKLSLPYYFDVVLNKKESNRLIEKVNLPDSPFVADEIAAQWQLFKHIDLFHKVIKSGYNVATNSGKNYIKSTLYSFAASKEIQWDKLSIKQYYLEDIKPTIFPQKSANGHFLLIRDCLGLAVESEWKQTTGQPIFTKENPDIDRFKSPLTYIPIRFNKDQFRVYINFTPIPKEFSKQVFSIKKNGHGDLKLETPPAFRIKEYLDFLKQINIDDLLQDTNENSQDIRLIKNVFTSYAKSK